MMYNLSSSLAAFVDRKNRQVGKGVGNGGREYL